MIFGLFRRSNSAIAKKQLDDFVEMLRGCAGSDLGLTVAVTEHFANSFALTGRDFYRPDELMHSRPDTLGWAVTEAQRLQASGLQVAAVGWIIWTHTFRATKFLELRASAKEMWVLLSQGFPFAHGQAETLLPVLGFVLQVENPYRFPTGFGPKE